MNYHLLSSQSFGVARLCCSSSDDPSATKWVIKISSAQECASICRSAVLSRGHGGGCQAFPLRGCLCRILCTLDPPRNPESDHHSHIQPVLTPSQSLPLCQSHSRTYSRCQPSQNTGCLVHPTTPRDRHSSTPPPCPSVTRSSLLPSAPGRVED